MASETFTFYVQPWYRKSPYWHLSAEAGCWRASVYNRMYHPRGYVRPEDGGMMVEYDALVNHVTLWNVAVERQIQVDLGARTQGACEDDGERDGAWVYLPARPVGPLQGGEVCGHAHPCQPAAGPEQPAARVGEVPGVLVRHVAVLADPEPDVEPVGAVSSFHEHVPDRQRVLAPGDRDQRPLAVGLDSRTRGFDADRIVKQVKRIADSQATPVETLYLECQTPELLRRYSETRRRHPLAPDRPAIDGIAEEREMTAPLKRWADHVIDTTDCDPNMLRQQVRDRFGGPRDDAPTLSLISFGFARGVPRNADLVFDMRFLRNPHWEKELRELTGLDEAVGAHIAGDEAYEEALVRIEELLLTLLPRYRAEGKAYVSVAFGCTGGRHRSVHVAERVAARLREAGFSPTLDHRDLATPPRDGIERTPGERAEGTKANNSQGG